MWYHFTLVAFCSIVRADVIQVGLKVSSGIQTSAYTVGTITFKEDPIAGQRIADFAKEYGVGLRENEEYVTNEDNFVYPCGSNENDYDYNCIREFFANNSDCSPACGPVPNPLVLAQNTAFFPSVNMTQAMSNVTYEGLSNATVCTFYYNKVSGKLVFAIKIPAVYVSSSEIYFIYRRPCQENIVKSGYVKSTFKSIIFTAIIPQVAPFGKLRLDLADVNAYIENVDPEYAIDPDLIKSTNPVVIAESNALLENLSIVRSELFYLLSHLFTAIYIQTNICDFGLELYTI